MRMLAAATAAFALAASPAFAHGIVGDRFFPATLSTEDPFTSDELALPTVSYMDGETELSFDYGKSITPRLALSLGGAWTHGPEGDGFQNIETGVKYRLFSNAAHESIVSVGVEAELGGTGAERVGAESTTTVAPTLYFGRGFGDLPEFRRARMRATRTATWKPILTRSNTGSRSNTACATSPPMCTTMAGPIG